MRAVNERLLEACKVLTKAFANLAVTAGLEGDDVLYFPDAKIKMLVGDIVACGRDAIVAAEADSN